MFETILVIAILALVAAGLLAMQPQVFKAQNDGRDQVAGLEILRACGERLLTARRTSGLGSVTSTLCDGLGGTGGFAANPTVSLRDASDASVTACSSATCTATISVTKAVGSASLVPLTLQLSSY